MSCARPSKLRVGFFVNFLLNRPGKGDNTKQKKHQTKHQSSQKEETKIPIADGSIWADEPDISRGVREPAQAGAAAALYGPLHGGANEAVLKMLREIGTVDRIPNFLEQVKNGEAKLMGFGHRVYKSYDPRAKVIKDTAYDVFNVTGRNPLLDIALELERIALQEDYFVSRRLYPNVDFYSGLIYEAMGFPMDMFTVLFAIGRTPGWLAHWQEMLDDPEQKIYRPRQMYTGPGERDYVAISKR